MGISSEFSFFERREPESGEGRQRVGGTRKERGSVGLEGGANGGPIESRTLSIAHLEVFGSLDGKVGSVVKRTR